MKAICNSEPSLSKVIGDIREAWKVHKYLVISWTHGKRRSLDQNAISHAWYAQIAEELREDTEGGVKRFCKLHFGVPIMRRDDEFRDAYDQVIKPLEYSLKLIAMDHWHVTSLMDKGQLSEYLESIQHAYTGSVCLEFPTQKG